ncbi:PAS domain S-box protein [Azospirillum sp. RWY-5-1]|uniref:histidine kinase n=1 Tax=Azospirillum oleiclasticum TaxID=2735135 RepID=A0ABX2TL65_9PROT|nr:PAS domain S-box protein [Azospirillum oleiclasticum]NYZ23839.1 PAS domain S-box protein [Azospirillum oleiclasticum]
MAALWGLALLLIVSGERQAAARAERDTGNLARIIAEQTERVISEADQILRYVGYDIRKFGHWHPNLREVMREAKGRSDVLVQLSIVDADGRLAQTSVDSAPARINLSDREHFRVQRENPARGLFISKPVFGRTSGRWSLQLTRAIETGDGDFGGVLVASIDPFYFSRTFQELDVGDGGAIAIIGLDGILRAQSGIDDLSIGADLGDSELMTIARRQGTGFTRTTGPADRKRRLIAFRTLPNHPLMVIASFSESAFDADLLTRRTIYLGSVAACTAALLALAWLAARQSARQAMAQAMARETEGRLRESEQRFRDVAETASDWFWEMGPDLRFTNLTGPLAPELSKGRSLIGCTRQEVAVREAGDDAKWEDHHRILAEHRPFRSFEYRARLAAGERVFSVSGRPIFGESGRFLGYRGSATDITERKMAEERLLASETRYRRMVDAVGQPILTFDRSGIIDGVNPAAERLFGYTAADVVGSRVTTLVPAIMDAVRAVMERGADARLETTGRRGDGSAFPLEMVLASWRVDDRRLVTGIIRDITAQKQIEDDLRQARDSADRANRLKGEFLATMSHEIRTPMNGILGALELLEGPNLDAGQRHLIDIARRSGAGLQQIIDDVLDLSKLEAGRIAIEPVDFDLRQLLRDVVDLLRPLAIDKSLSLGWGIGEGVPARLRSDPVRLRQILINLIGNAIKFTPAGSVEVRAERAGTGGDGGLLLRLSVADTGIGIPDDLRPRLFQRFTQGDGSTTRRFGGTGLGLAICRELTTLLGGDIGVDSVEGEGSVFHLTIPCRPATAAAEAPAEPAVVANRSLSVLVAEDNEVSRSIVTAILERAGHRVTAVDDGLKALEAAARGGFDALLMDVQMPTLDGPEATRRIRALPGPAGAVPIVALTANAMKGHREALLADGMTDYLTKPVNPSILLATLARVAGPSAPAWEPPPPVAGSPVDGPPLDEVQTRSVFDAVGPAVWVVALDTFERSAADLAADIRTAIEDGSGPRPPAHALKGAAGSIGAARLARLAARIETASPDDLPRLGGRLDGELQATMAALRAFGAETVA